MSYLVEKKFGEQQKEIWKTDQVEGSYTRENNAHLGMAHAQS